MFKENNSRFSVLLEKNTSSHEKVFTKNRDADVSINKNKDRNNREPYTKMGYSNKSRNIFQNNDNAKKEFAFSEEMFPSLSNNIVNVKEGSNETNFLDKLLTINNDTNQDKKWNLSSGWVEITMGDQNLKFSYNYGKNMKKDKETSLFDVCRELSLKYEKWEKEYIEKWGENEYEKMYKFPNYDYDYFNRLDEKWNEESEDEDENDEEYTDYYDDYSDYY